MSVGADQGIAAMLPSVESAHDGTFGSSVLLVSALLDIGIPPDIAPIARKGLAFSSFAAPGHEPPPSLPQKRHSCFKLTLKSEKYRVFITSSKSMCSWHGPAVGGRRSAVVVAESDENERESSVVWWRWSGEENPRYGQQDQTKRQEMAMQD